MTRGKLHGSDNDSLDSTIKSKGTLLGASWVIAFPKIGRAIMDDTGWAISFISSFALSLIPSAVKLFVYGKVDLTLPALLEMLAYLAVAFLLIVFLGLISKLVTAPQCIYRRARELIFELESEKLEQFSSDRDKFNTLQNKFDSLTQPKLKVNTGQLVLRETPAQNLGVDTRYLMGWWKFTISNQGANTTLHNWSASILVDGCEYPCDSVSVSRDPLNENGDGTDINRVLSNDVKHRVLFFQLHNFDDERFQGKERTFRFQFQDHNGAYFRSHIESGIWTDDQGRPIHLK